MIIAFVLLLLSLAGCTSHINFSEPYHLKAVDRIPVALDPALANKVESSSFMMEQGTYALAPALAYVIENRPDAPIKIEYVSSTLDITQATHLLISETTMADYTLLVKQTTGTTSTLVEARGKGTSAWGSVRAAQEAIEKAVIDLVTKVKALRS